jgi:hypothetical protein
MVVILLCYQQIRIQIFSTTKLVFIIASLPVSVPFSTMIKLLYEVFKITGNSIHNIYTSFIRFHYYKSFIIIIIIIDNKNNNYRIV